MSDWREKMTEIERLRAENERLRKALQPFADVADEHLCESDTGQIWDVDIASHITFDALRAAAAAIREGGNNERK